MNLCFCILDAFWERQHYLSYRSKSRRHWHLFFGGSWHRLDGARGAQGYVLHTCVVVGTWEQRPPCRCQPAAHHLQSLRRGVSHGAQVHHGTAPVCDPELRLLGYLQQTSKRPAKETHCVGYFDFYLPTVLLQQC